RPQDRIALSGMKSQWEQDLSLTFGKASPARDSTQSSFLAEGGQSATGAAAGTAIAAAPEPGSNSVTVEYDNQTFELQHGAVVIAAITSCTNASNPEVMLGAGLVARK